MFRKKSKSAEHTTKLSRKCGDKYADCKVEATDKGYFVVGKRKKGGR